ncbi:MAG: hypothetical protein QF921_13320 [Pseudomonadales bacterium]|jgi:hypothetical protein|nr:hypothetical protein [Pseudomonadales bacterium]MDP6470323.1 hypothetical protein [Pseudomonadales bacterium]MDP6827229.1 hypothetical protein [Pseudomonadales bacterium]MDP6972468.1 hypothetical protein [Pseudomonadales bacterium]
MKDESEVGANEHWRPLTPESIRRVTGGCADCKRIEINPPGPAQGVAPAPLLPAVDWSLWHRL